MRLIVRRFPILFKRTGRENPKINLTYACYNFFSSHYGCPLPCKFISYKVKVNYFHKNSYLAVEINKTTENAFYVYFYYTSLVVEKRVETLVYDIGGFLAAAGGNMGLTLGLSFLTIFFSIIDWMRSLLLTCTKKFLINNFNPELTKVEKF